MPPITDISQLDLDKQYTYADYLTWQLDGFVELIRGKVRRMSPAPRRAHQEVLRNFARPIFNFLDDKPCKAYVAPFDVRLTKTTPNDDQQITTVVQPDICAVCDLAKLDEQGCVGAPDWIIEILSPGNTVHDSKTKFDLYEENGVTEYWMVNYGLKNIVVYVLENGRYQLRGEFFEPGPIPVYALSGLTLEWTDAFKGV
ncbi:MAG: Uma2 family endonuclease [Hymenobacter sp.]|nr:Uma2 family endonuclease [Hymenobacter sp.]